jgi:hypothetical protein
VCINQTIALSDGFPCARGDVVSLSVLSVEVVQSRGERQIENLQKLVLVVLVCVQS